MLETYPHVPLTDSLGLGIALLSLRRQALLGLQRRLRPGARPRPSSSTTCTAPSARCAKPPAPWRCAARPSRRAKAPRRGPRSRTARRDRPRQGPPSRRGRRRVCARPSAGPYSRPRETREPPCHSFRGRRPPFPRVSRHAARLGVPRGPRSPRASRGSVGLPGRSAARVHRGGGGPAPLLARSGALHPVRGPRGRSPCRDAAGRRHARGTARGTAAHGDDDAGASRGAAPPERRTARATVLLPS